MSSGQYNLVQGLVELDGGAFEIGRNMPLGLSATVDVVAGSAENVLLLPVEALREREDGSYYVYVINGQTPELREVELGLKDYTYAEVLDGLRQGEVVATGDVEANG